VWIVNGLWHPLGRFAIGLFCFASALILMLLVGERMIQWLRAQRWRKDAETWTVREDTPDTHQAKQGTPSMGGIGIVGATLLAFVSWQVFVHAIVAIVPPPAGQTRAVGWATDVWCIPVVAVFLLTHALLGFADDRSKATGRGGLTSRQKLVAQALLSAGLLAYVRGISHGYGPFATKSADIPWYLFFDGSPASPILVASLCLILLVGTSNAVNLTDGIDGLASGLAVQCGIAFMLVGSTSIDGWWDNDLFWACLAGACCGFLFFNKYPAKVFMGDTGSLAIGAALGAAAILMHAVWLLPFIGFMFFVEAASVTLQVLWFKWTRKRTGEAKRLFRRAPLHHHFELGGWSEWRVVATFWGANLVTTIIGLVLWHTGVLPRFP